MHVAACLASGADVEQHCGDFGAVGPWVGDGRAPGGCATLQDRGRRELHLRYGRGRDEAEEHNSKTAWLSHEGLSEFFNHSPSAEIYTLSLHVTLPIPKTPPGLLPNEWRLSCGAVLE